MLNKYIRYNGRSKMQNRISKFRVNTNMECDLCKKSDIKLRVSSGWHYPGHKR